MTFVSDLRIVLRVRDFRRLYATRLISQTADGIFQVGIAGYVFFSPEQQASAGEAAAAAAVLLLPYSLVGPFAGVFIDRWRRRQILVWAPLVRAVILSVAAALLLIGHDQALFYLAALLALALNRFFLSALSASLPHVVRRDELIMGNSVSVTSGTAATFVGAGLGFLLRLVFGAGQSGAALILLGAATGYVIASLTATTLGRNRLGPDPQGSAQPLSPALSESPVATVPAAATSAQLDTMTDVVRWLREGARHVWSQRPAAAALAAMGAHRFLYGVATMMTILLFRNYFHDDAEEGLGGFALVLSVSGAGFLLAAIITPPVTARMSKEAWIGLQLAAAGAALAAFASTFNELLFVVGAFFLGLSSQCVKLCVDTIVQERILDAFRGRVFSFYDMIFNGVFVLGFACAALTLPASGRSMSVLLSIIVVYLVTAAAYTLTNRAGPQVATQGSNVEA